MCSEAIFRIDVIEINHEIITVNLCQDGCCGDASMDVISAYDGLPLYA